MRVVKLSNNDPSFPNLDDVRDFFLEKIHQRKPPGKFRVPANKIKHDKFSSGEMLVFTYQARVVFTAMAKSELLHNDDSEYQKYPYYFVIDLATLRETNEDLYKIERQVNEETGQSINLVRSQGWIYLDDPAHTQYIWKQLREAVNLKPVDYNPTTNHQEYYLRSDRIRFQGPISRPIGLLKPRITTGTTTLYYRDPKVRAWVLQRADDHCELCDTLAPFFTENNVAYLESHHIIMLSEGGNDTPDNTAALCPNCHRNLHYGITRENLQEQLSKIVLSEEASLKG